MINQIWSILSCFPLAAKDIKRKPIMSRSTQKYLRSIHRWRNTHPATISDASTSCLILPAKKRCYNTSNHDALARNIHKCKPMMNALSTKLRTHACFLNQQFLVSSQRQHDKGTRPYCLLWPSWRAPSSVLVSPVKNFPTVQKLKCQCRRHRHV